MSEKLNLKQIERKAWRSVFQDGLWDIYLGLLLLLMGSSLLLDQLPIGEAARLGIYLGLMAVCLVGMWLAKTYITIPRTGRAQFGPARQIRRKKVGIILAADWMDSELHPKEENQTDGYFWGEALAPSLPGWDRRASFILISVSNRSLTLFSVCDIINTKFFLIPSSLQAIGEGGHHV